MEMAMKMIKMDEMGIKIPKMDENGYENTKNG
jgi:hypothetical protein